jgi:hypothetical protein
LGITIHVVLFRRALFSGFAFHLLGLFMNLFPAFFGSLLF